MRALKTVGFALVCFGLGGCAAETPKIEPSATVRIPDTIFKPPVTTKKTPGQPRLSTLLAKQPAEIETPPPELSWAPSVRQAEPTPSEVVVPKSVVAAKAPETQTTKTIAPASPQIAAVQKPAIVKPSPPEPVVLAVSATPAPLPRPIASTPRPTRRPVTQVAALLPAPAVEPSPLPARPTISPLGGRSLQSPSALRDTTLLGLPTLASQEASIPLGTLPASLGLANLKAGEATLPVSDTLEQSGADESGALGWGEATDLLLAGEVETAVDIGEFEVLMTLCSGRGVITIQPTPGALQALELPKVICGKTAALTSQ